MGGDSDPLSALAEEFLARWRRGESPSVSEYVARHPDLGEEIRDLLSTLKMLEEVAPGAHGEPRLPQQLGDYRILREIGRGGMGVVYEAEQIPLGRHVALKVLPFHRLLDPTRLERFRREAQAAARLHHKNIVPVYGVGEYRGTHFFAMQYVAGQGLDAVIAEIRRIAGGGPSSSSVRLPGHASTGTGGKSQYFASVARIGVAVAEALEHAHAEGVLHRDIKPSNLLLDGEGTVWVTDFGLAKADEADGMTRTGDIVGTVGYMAPERFQGWADPRSDVYGLGLVLYEMLVLKPAFADSDINLLIRKVVEEDPTRPRAVDRRVPVDLETIVLTAVAKDPARRYQTATLLRQELERFLAGEPIQARRSSSWERVGKWARRRPAAAALILVSFTAVLLLLGGSLWYGARLRGALVKAENEKDAKDAALRRARALALAAASENAQAADPELALLLAREAMRVARLPEATARLRAALKGPALRVSVPVEHLEFAAFALGGSCIATWNPEGEVVLWRLDGSELARLARLDGATDDRIAAVVDGGLLLVDRDGRETILPGEAKAGCVAFSPDGTVIAIGAPDGSCRLWNVAERTQTVALPPVGGGIESVAFAPSGKLLATAASDGGAHVYDSRGNPVLSIPSEGNGVLVVRFSPDSRRLLTRREPGSEASISPGARALGIADPALPEEVRIWTIENGRAVVLKAAVGIDGTEFSPRGDLVLTDSAAEATLWDTEGRCLATLPRGATFLGDHFLCTAAMGPDFICNRAGKRVAEWEGGSWPSPGRDHVLTHIRGFMSPGERVVRVLASDGREVAVLRGHEAEIKCVGFSRTGSRIVTVAGDRTARVWDLEGDAVGVLRHGTEVEDAQLSPDGDRVVTRTADSAFHVWDLDECGQVVVRVGKSGELPVAAFAGADRLLVQSAGNAEPSVTSYDRQGRRERELEGALCLPDPAAAFTREGDGWLLAGDGVRLIDLHGNVRATFGAGNKFDGALFSPSGQEILGARLGPCVLWDRAGNEIAVLPRGGLAPCFSPDGDLIVGAGRNGPASLFRRDGTELSAIDPGEGRGVITAVFHPTRGLLLAVSARIEIFEPLPSLFRETDISLWDITDPHRPVRRWSRAGFLAAEFSPSGERILTPSPDNAARLFDLDGNEATALRGHTSFVVHACFSPSGDRIVTTSMDGTARLWDEQGRLLEILRGHAGPVIWASFSSSGLEILTTGQDETVRIWPVYADDLLALANRRVSREFTAEERERYADLLVAGETR